jgi:hypothetical protein
MLYHHPYFCYFLINYKTKKTIQSYFHTHLHSSLKSQGIIIITNNIINNKRDILYIIEMYYTLLFREHATLVSNSILAFLLNLLSVAAPLYTPLICCGLHLTIRLNILVIKTLFGILYDNL